MYFYVLGRVLDMKHKKIESLLFHFYYFKLGETFSYCLNYKSESGTLASVL